jgi:hypothetical protein
MTRHESPEELDWRAALPFVCLVAGIVFLLLSVGLPKRTLNKGSWSQEQAEKYQAASVKLHSLSLALLHPSPDSDPAAQRKELEQAEKDYQAIRSQLDSALARPSQITWILRGIGMALLAIGGYSAHSMRSGT